MKNLKDSLNNYEMLKSELIQRTQTKYEVVVNMGGKDHRGGYQILLIKEKTPFQDLKKILFAESREDWGYSLEVSLKLFDKQVQGAKELADELNGSNL